MTDTFPRPLDELAASVAARRRGVLAALSPWARQMLLEPRGAGVPGAARGRLSLTAPERFPISQRVSTARFVERPWNLGALTPDLPEHFAEHVIRRFPAVAARYELKEMGEGGWAAPELPMVEGDLAAAPELPEAPSPEPGLPAAPRPRPSAPQSFGSLKEQIAALRAEAEARAQAGMPSRTAQISAAVRRPPGRPSAPTRAPERPRPGEALVPRRPAQPVRRFAQIEELTPPGAKAPAPEAAPRRAEEPKAPSTPTDVMRPSPAAPPPPLEREAAPARADVAPSIEARMPQPLPVEPEPPVDRAPTAPPSEAKTPPEAIPSREPRADFSRAGHTPMTEAAASEIPSAETAPPEPEMVARSRTPLPFRETERPATAPASPEAGEPRADFSRAGHTPMTEAAASEIPSAETAPPEPEMVARSRTPLPFRETERPATAPASPEAGEPPAVERAPQPPQPARPAPAIPKSPEGTPQPPATMDKTTTAPAGQVRRAVAGPETMAEPRAPEAAPPEERLPLRRRVVTEHAPPEPAPRPDEVAPGPPPKSRGPEARPAPVAEPEALRAEPRPAGTAEGLSPAPTVVSRIAQPLPLPRLPPEGVPETQAPATDSLAALNETVLSRVVSSARLPTLRAPSLSTRRARRTQPAPPSTERVEKPVSEPPTSTSSEAKAPARVAPVAAPPPHVTSAASVVRRAPEPESADDTPLAVLLRSRPAGRTAVLPQARQLLEETQAHEAGPRWTPPAREESDAPALPLRVPVARASAPEQFSDAVGRHAPEPVGAPLTLAAEPPRRARPSITATRTGIVQRAEDEPGTPGEARSKPKRDLDALARQVLPFLKRILAVERERRSGY